MTTEQHLARAIELLEARVNARETPIFTNDLKVMKEALEHLKKAKAVAIEEAWNHLRARQDALVQVDERPCDQGEASDEEIYGK